MTPRLPVLLAALVLGLPVAPAAQQEGVPAVPGARRVEMPGANHLLPLWDPGGFTRILLDFLRP